MLLNQILRKYVGQVDFFVFYICLCTKFLPAAAGAILGKLSKIDGGSAGFPSYLYPPWAIAAMIYSMPHQD